MSVLAPPESAEQAIHGHASAGRVGRLLARPLPAVTAAFACGTLLTDRWPAAWIPLTVLCMAGIAGALRSRQSAGLAILLAFGAAGSARYAWVAGPASDDVSRYAGGYSTVRGTIVSPVDARRDALLCHVAARRILMADGEDRVCSGRLAVRLAPDPHGIPPTHGDDVELTGLLERPQGTRNPGGFDYAAYLSHHHVFAIMTVRRPGEWSIPGHGAGIDPFGRWAALARHSLVASLVRSMPLAESGVTAGALLGVRSDLPKPVSDDFAATGTVHILATAGLHVGAAAWGLDRLLRAARLRRRWRAVVLIPTVVFYGIMAGSRPAAMRAALMVGTYFGADLVDRDRDAVSALAAAALGLLAAAPGLVFDIGFQFSFATVGTILLIMPIVEPALSRLHRRGSESGRAALALRWSARWAATMAALSAAAQLGSAPITAQYFNQVSLIAVPANALIVPALPFMLASGFLTWIAAAIAGPAGSLIGHYVAQPIAWYVMGAARLCASVPHATCSVPSPGWATIACYYGALVAGAYWLRGRIPESPDPESSP